MERLGRRRTDGELQFHETFRENKTLFDLHHAGWEALADGNRFAAAVMKIKGARAFFDVGGHAYLERVMVFEIASRQWIYRLDAKKQKLTDISVLQLFFASIYFLTIPRGAAVCFCNTVQS